MRVLVCGPRDWTDDDYVWDVLDCIILPNIKLLISGCADGIDAISCEWANARGVPVLPFPARWYKYKKSAGPIRNRKMLEDGKPDLVFAFRYPGEPLTQGMGDMVKQAEKAGIRIRVFPKLEEKQ
jgi:hypothetical protein